ncbi:MAG: acetyl-CoA carboxylase biotin carboxylase subunit [Thermodesulfobacteriaceae bacterium]|nr:acetyl-CoA carboxylase biotin carboxylase subunit [Thermodesulfobacteriaceae bacterium]MCX8041434.1 acetyl-CoA carboxylase biotin carboxylase subunit [Thermodesulfobacteriaceae bacterium]MDW8135397.1 biotin carboxylase N-terminal domain-containing protein [Thermodesulfobacterium sp.]
MKERLLIANRGEIALRIMEACEELGLDYVAVYTKEDEESLHVRLAKKKVRISDYRDINDLLAVADENKCSLIHPGYGFLSEDYRFARRVEKRERPLIFVGPSWEAIRDLGNKIYLKKLASQLKIPVIPGTTEPIYNEIEAEFKAEELLELLKEEGFEYRSLFIKAAAGGGGMGIEEVKNLEEVRPVFRKIRAYAKRLFGDEGVLIEAKIPVIQHVEVQILGSKKGEYVHFGTRNCTIQSPFKQKRIEIAPGFDFNKNFSLNLQKIESEIIKYSLRLAKNFGYYSLGTWEWLVTPEGKYYLMEVNTRVQVENEISGKISFINNNSVNLIKEQIKVALGERLEYTQEEILFKGTSIELRLIAEDVSQGFQPLSGTITHFKWKPESWLTIRTHVPQDKPYNIPTQFDPNLALAIIYGENFELAKRRAQEFLENLIIEGVTSKGEKLKTNKEYLKEKLEIIYQFLPS